jgi:hypothetical protein
MDHRNLILPDLQNIYHFLKNIYKNNNQATLQHTNYKVKTLVFVLKLSSIKVFIFADLLIFADSANSKFADFADLRISAKNENPG